MPWRIITTEADVDQAVSDHRTAEVHTLDQPPEDHGNAAHTPNFEEEEERTTIASSSTPTPTGGSSRNFFTVTALEEGATFAAPSGTPANGNRLVIRILDNGTARTLAWNAIYRRLEFALPTTTVISKTMYLGFIYNSADSKWDMVASNEEA